MPPNHIIANQLVDPQKIARARELRQQMTQAELLLWQRLRTNRLAGWHFRRQQVIGGFIVDFYCHQAGLVVEVDGEVHSAQVEADAARDQILAGYDLRVLRFPNRAVEENLEAVLAQILKACEERRQT